MIGGMQRVSGFLPPAVRKRLVKAWWGVSTSGFRRMLTVHAPQLRGALFDAMQPGSVVIADTEQGTFATMRDDLEIARSMFVTGIAYEFGKLLTLRSLLAETHVATHLVDIGANLGSVSIAAVNRGMFESADAIEPEPRNFRLLSANVYLNGLEDRIARHNVALGDEDGATLEFALSSENFGDHRVAKTVTDRDIDRSHTIAVTSRRLDALLPDLDPGNSVIWMDVQGYEGHVLAGASRILGGRPPLVLEFWPTALAATGSYSILRDAVMAAGYTGFHVLDTSAEKVRLTPTALDALYDELLPTSRFVDVLFV